MHADAPMSCGTSRIRRLAIMSALLATAAPDRRLCAQGTGSAVSGVVTVLEGAQPLAGASIVLDESQHTAASDSAGRYRITGVPPGDYVLTVRRIGFEAVSARITVVAGSELTADVQLKPSVSVQQLGEVRVTADSQRWGKLAAMEHRRDIHAGGTFITAAELDSAAGRSLPTVLARKLPGAQITLYARTGGALLSSGRGRTSQRELPLADPADPRSPRGCYAQVYLDGMRIYSIKHNGMAVPDLRDFRVESLSGVEYYAGEAQTPSEFAGEGAACGTIVLWTR
jgi:hypothetical protein